MKQRIDKIIAQSHPLLSRSDIKEIIESGGVFVDGEKIQKNGEKIEETLKIYIDSDILEKVESKKRIDLNPDPDIKFDIIYEDKDIAIIEKPAGLVVHPSYSHKSQTLVNGLVAKWPNIIGVGDDFSRPGIVHRLDKDVSGIMAIAKTNEGFYSLKKQFQERTIKKIYIAVVYGKPPEEEGVIDGAIMRSKYDPVKQMISDEGKPAITEYKFIKSYCDNPMQSIIECHPLTGRMHQIRVHLASIGCPIVGDKKYLPKNLLETDISDRIMLFAKSIEIEMISGERRVFESSPLGLV